MCVFFHRSLFSQTKIIKIESSEMQQTEEHWKTVKYHKKQQKNRVPQSNGNRGSSGVFSRLGWPIKGNYPQSHPHPYSEKHGRYQGPRDPTPGGQKGDRGWAAESHSAASFRGPGTSAPRPPPFHQPDTRSYSGVVKSNQTKRAQQHPAPKNSTGNKGSDGKTKGKKNPSNFYPKGQPLKVINPNPNPVFDFTGSLAALEASLKLIQEQIDSLRNQTSTRHQPAQQETSPDQEKYRQVVKETFRYVQVQHHRSNWTKVPAGVQAALDKVVSNIKPPMPNPQLQNELAALGAHWGEMLLSIINKHLSSCCTHVSEAILKLDNSEAAEAIRTAEAQLRRKMGKRLKAEDRTRWLEEAGNLLRITEQTSDPTTRTSPRGDYSSDAALPTPQPAAPDTPMEGVRLSQSSSGDGQLDPNAGPSDRPLETFPSAREPGETPSRRRARSSGDEGSPRDTPLKRPLFKKNPELTVVPEDGVILLNKEDTRPITIPPQIKYVFVGDSNLQRLRDLPDSVVISIRGGLFTHVTEAVKRMTFTRKLLVLIVAAGINHRTAKDISTVAPSFWALHNTLRNTRQPFGFLGISFSEALPEDEKRMLEEVNRLIKDSIEPGTFLDPLPCSDVETIRDGVHYTENTLNKLKAVFSQYVFFQ